MRLFIAAALLALPLGACSSCSEECAGDKAGNAGCSCSSDQDCTTKLGTVLLCVDGSCKKGDPEDVPGDACGDDGDCGAGQGCGIDQLCLAAPTCQRIDAELTATAQDGSSAAVTATRDDCAHTWTTAAFDLNVGVRIGLDGVMTVTDAGGGGCDAGRWFAGDRVGELECTGGVVVALTPTGVAACHGAAACNACNGRVVDDTTGVGVCL